MVARDGSTVVENSTHIHEIEGLNPAVTGRDLLARAERKRERERES
jgi:hypothetical protein